MVGEFQNLAYVVSSIQLFLLEVSNYRRGEEHSFILKPATSMLKILKVQDERNSQLSKLQSGNSASILNPSSQSLDRRKVALTDDQYAIVVSCRCNYTGTFLTPWFVVMLYIEC